MPIAAAETYLQLKRWHNKFQRQFHFFTLVAKPGMALHTKAVIVDSDLACLGSGNWDLRSFNLDSNSYVVLNLQDQSVGELLTQLIDYENSSWHRWEDSEFALGQDYLLKKLGEKKFKTTQEFLRKKEVKIQL